MSSGHLTELDRYRGCLLGLAAGDALGTTLEFKAPGTFAPVTDLIGGGPFQLDAGQWTDDTSMALCLAESLLACEKFHPYDQMQRYVRWYREGYLSSTGTCFDIGNTVRDALERFERTGEAFSGVINRTASGNGALMRLAPVPLYFARDPEEAIIRSGDSSLTTHGSILSVDACRYFGGLIIGALSGVHKTELLSERYSPAPSFMEKRGFVPEIDAIALGSFKQLHPPDIRGTGYVVQSLEAALWAFYHSGSFAEGCLMAANLGDDADTTAAIYGQLAGAYYGVDGIPAAWLDKLAMRSFIDDTAVKLYHAAGEESRCG
ncbi:ADP-ribosylglycohydrolase family protein [Paenibacillus xerothermodurans]|uniref:ADP-ribosylglycohydrolase family protein n=1 Tax=Paenibacillus xerothermodurans TaxID=1977292 RepID=A0A2W1NE10_PAEXE|nr:ADP-ribosylglycohydrolase family protein [Paenibacillus xerothermodurans]PZE21850.1 ADP-ribosylglycohydrolase family protein [Paenibacillus xerothermodurans]